MIKKFWNFFDKYTSTLLVVLSFILVLAFCITNIILAFHGIMLSDTLIVEFIRFFGYELIALSGIKITKHLCGSRDIRQQIDEDVAELDTEECVDESY